MPDNPILAFLIRLDMVVFQIITLGVAKKNETISAAAYNAELTGRWVGKLARPVIDLLFSPFQKQHCREAWLWQQELYR
jgi:hypothetical protein